MFFLRFLALTIIVYNIFGIMIKLGRAKKLATVFRWIMRAGYAVFAASFLVVISLILAYAAPDKPENADYIIVLGAGLNGTEPSLVLADRLNKAYEMMRVYPNADVILCGGQGINEQIPESQAMYNYLVKKSADPERLICESRSTDTDENIKNAGEMIYELGGTRDVDVLLVTNSFHMMRSKLIAKKYGLNPYAATSRTRPQEYHYYVREYFSLILYAVELTGISIDTSSLGM